MAWSTRELAELAGTTLRAVRHYHQVGLLAEPERRSNGYKQYGVAHLVRLLRIKRLVDLGLSLPQIAELGELDDHPAEALRALDAELAATIDRLQRARAELRDILDQAAPTDLPPELAPVARVNLSEADRSFVAVLGRIVGPEQRRAWAGMLQDLPDDPVATEFDTLPDDADEPTRQAVAERMIPYVHALRARHPELDEPYSDAPRGARFAERTVSQALRDLHNSAQLDVLRRIHTLLLREGRGDDRPAGHAAPSARREQVPAAPAEGPDDDQRGECGQRPAHRDPGDAQPAGLAAEVEPLLHAEPGTG